MEKELLLYPVILFLVSLANISKITFNLSRTFSDRKGEWKRSIKCLLNQLICAWERDAEEGNCPSISGCGFWKLLLSPDINTGRGLITFEKQGISMYISFGSLFILVAYHVVEKFPSSLISFMEVTGCGHQIWLNNLVWLFIQTFSSCIYSKKKDKVCYLFLHSLFDIMFSDILLGGTVTLSSSLGTCLYLLFPYFL